VLAGRGYFSGEEVRTCEELGITPICPKPLTSGAKVDGRSGKQDFRYDPPSDTYRCPAAEMLSRRFTSVENGLTVYTYWADACATCTVKAQCTTGKERRIKRWEHEHVAEAMQARLERMPHAMRSRATNG
jgi:transposase